MRRLLYLALCVGTWVPLILGLLACIGIARFGQFMLNRSENSAEGIIAFDRWLDRVRAWAGIEDANA
jgi:hypothetical protein